MAKYAIKICYDIRVQQGNEENWEMRSTIGSLIHFLFELVIAKSFILGVYWFSNIIEIDSIVRVKWVLKDGLVFPKKVN